MIHINKGDGEHEWVDNPEDAGIKTKPIVDDTLQKEKRVARKTVKEIALKTGFGLGEICDIMYGRDTDHEKIRKFREALK